jgi:D-alanyl-D-alanine carboxypeptidase
MARPDDPRPGRRSTGRFIAVALAAMLVLGGGAVLTAGALTYLPAAARGPAATDPLGAPLASHAQVAETSPSAPPASGEASPPPIPTPTPASTAPPADPPSRATARAIAIRARLELELDAVRARLGIPGVSVTIIFRDGTAWTGTSGLADVTRRVEVEPDTAFAVASISKTYTAALILAMAGEGRIGLDTPALTYLPGAALDPRITVRQLLNHTSGLDDFFLHPPIDKALLADPSAAWATSRTLKYVAKPYFPPGKGWQYANTNYLYLGLIAERVAGTSLAEALRNRFFGPLDLEATWYQSVEKPRVSIAHGYRFNGGKVSARPIDLSDGTSVAPFTSVVTAAAGAGSIAATSSDVARWARLLYTGEVLGPQLTAEMLDGVAGTAGYAPRVPYGLGVQAFPIMGRASVGHSGRLLGFRSAVRHLPGEGLTIAVLTNQSRADPGLVVADLLSIIFEPEPGCFRCRQAN